MSIPFLTVNPTINTFERKPYVFYKNDLQYTAESTDTESGRYYCITDSSGRSCSYPSITTILSKTQTQDTIDSLNRWKERVGEEEAEKITEKAGVRGSWLHNICEQFLKGEEYTLPLTKTNEYHLFRQVYPHLKKIDNIRLLEAPLWSHKLKIAGRVDLIAEYDGVLSIIDFKTTRKEKKREWIDSYFIQTAGYGIMYYNLYREMPKQTVIIMAKDNGFYQKEAFIFKENILQYKDKLLNRIEEYYKGVK